MIKFHYHTARRPIRRLGIRPGERLCHAYSDTDLADLQEWGRMHGLRPEWIDRRSAMPHFDLFGERLDLAGPGVTRDELVADLRTWRVQTGRARGRRKNSG
ncbi:MAG: hypothetical protein ACE5JR_10805 [Gemmatimonadota bacterium]